MLLQITNSIVFNNFHDDDVYVRAKKQIDVDIIIDKRSFDSFNKLVMVTGFVKRFRANCKRAIIRQQLQTGEIMNEEKMQAKQLWLLNEQSCVNHKELDQFKVALGAYRDEDGIIKLKGRLEYADLSLNCKFPILIPENSYIGDF